MGLGRGQRRGFTAILLTMVFLLTSGVPALTQTQTSYILGPGDVLEVSVFGYPDLTREVTVRPDGRIALPLVGTVPAAGVSVEQLTLTLTRALAFYFVNPKVSVIVRQFRRIQASVVGQVNRPGSYQLEPGARLMDLLSARVGLLRPQH